MKKLKKTPTNREIINLDTIYWHPKYSVIAKTPAVFNAKLRLDVIR